MDKPTLQQRFGEAARARRVAMGYSQDSFADAIRMHRAYYSSIERGERNVTIVTMGKVASGLKVKLSDLMRAAEI